MQMLNRNMVIKHPNEFKDIYDKYRELSINKLNAFYDNFTICIAIAIENEH